VQLRIVHKKNFHAHPRFTRSGRVNYRRRVISAAGNLAALLTQAHGHKQAVPRDRIVRNCYRHRFVSAVEGKAMP